MSRPITVAAVAAGLLALTWLAAAGNRPAHAADDLPDVVEVDAFTIPFRSLEIPGELGGVLVSMDVEEGDEVTEGEVLAEFKSDLRRVQVEVAEARVNTSIAQIAAAMATSEVADTEHERAKQLHSDSVMSAQELLKAELDAKVAKLNIEVAKVERTVRDLEVKQGNVVVARTVVHAPIDGVIFRIDKRAGEAVDAYEPILSMVALDPLYVIANVPVKTSGRIRPGMKAALRLETAPEEALDATVEIVDRLADAASGLYRVKLTLPNPEKNIIAGARGTVTFILP